MMRVEHREEDQSVIIVLRRGIIIGDDKGKQPEEDGWVHKVSEKEVGFDLAHANETFMESKKSFAEISTSRSHNKEQETNTPVEVDPSVLTTFLETCIKLLHDRKAVEGLQKLINKSNSKEKVPDEHRVVRKIGKHKARTCCEMRLTTQIGDYEMDQVILDLGSDVNILPNQIWERMGRPTLQWSLI